MLRTSLLVTATLTFALLQAHASLVVDDPPPGALSERQKQIAIEPTIRRATSCMSDAVSRDPRLGGEKISVLIADSVHECVRPVHAMIELIDRYYGGGVGWAYFYGEFVNDLPKQIEQTTKSASH